MNTEGASIKLELLHHKGEAFMALRFPYREDWIAICKQLGARWSATHRCWILPHTMEQRKALFAAFRGKAWLDQSSLPYLSDKKEDFKEKTGKQVQPSLAVAVPEEFILRLQRQRYSENTQKAYIAMFQAFLAFIHPTQSEHITEEHIRTYQDYLVHKRKVSTSTQNQAINAIKFYLEKVAGGERKTYFVERPRKEKKLPIVLSEEEVLRIFSATPNPKHRLVFAMLYSTGMRISEILNLRIQDVDLDRNLVHIKGAKGKKDRISTISHALKPVIETYYQEHKPRYWFLEGPNRTQYSASSIRKSLWRSVKAAGIIKHVTPHTLRHSFATHLLERGTDTRYIQELLGHSSLETTAIYAQVSNKSVRKIENPLDAILRDKTLTIKKLNKD